MRPLLALVFAATVVSAQDAISLPWLGDADRIAEYMRSARIEKFENIPVGVTRPRRAILAAGGPVSSVVVKDLRPGRTGGFWESYRSEIAAYELDRLLDLNMVPPTVEKRVEGSRMSAQMFVDHCVWLKELKGQEPPNVVEWNRQVHRQRVFDNLIANIDRNAGNLLVYRGPLEPAGASADWRLVLVDHSRCFTTAKMPFQMTHIDRPFFERLKALDTSTLEARLGTYVMDGVASILSRRDAIVQHFHQLVAVKGEDRVFTP